MVGHGAFELLTGPSSALPALSVLRESGYGVASLGPNAMFGFFHNEKYLCYFFVMVKYVFTVKSKKKYIRNEKKNVKVTS